ncbi:MAG: polymerase, sigma-24 subunit, subfamily [Acidobacteria bacterium]|nr:polymerase, sigma-24 subunit, subfamily [Acidobacteriota bacterium]
MSDASEPQRVTQLLVEWQNGSPQALDRLIPLVYSELRTIARRYLSRESVDHTLQSTALVHEAYFRLVGQRRVQWQNRAHFFGIAAQMMRRILVDHARHQHRDKRGGPAPKLSLDEALAVAAPESEVDLLALDDALTALARIDPRGARIVELRFFSALTIDETAEVLDVSAATVKRDWNAARAWLYREMGQQLPPSA